ncbi:hypothetical protein IV102_26475 [bacterium]|nr:hypothetical protein [bacterium]
MAGSINNSFSAGAGHVRSTSHGKGKDVAANFQKALHSASGIGYEASGDLAQIGLQAVANQHQASDAEKLVAKAVLQQAADVETSLTKEGVMRDSGLGSRYCMLTEGLGYLAAGGCANGPIGVVLADLGNRQMDSTRAQSFNTASVCDVRDSNVVGFSMLNQIAQNVDDPNIQLIAGQALEQLGDRYSKSERSDRIGGDREVLYQDSNQLHQAFDAIKVVAALGEPHNPKLMAMMEGKLPEGSGGSYSLGRPGGGYAEYTSPEHGFGVTRAPRPFDR